MRPDRSRFEAQPCAAARPRSSAVPRKTPRRSRPSRPPAIGADRRRPAAATAADRHPPEVPVAAAADRRSLPIIKQPGPRPTTASQRNPIRPTRHGERRPIPMTAQRGETVWGLWKTRRGCGQTAKSRLAPRFIHTLFHSPPTLFPQPRAEDNSNQSRPPLYLSTPYTGNEAVAGLVNLARYFQQGITRSPQTPASE